MSRTELNEEIMKYFDDAVAVLNSKPEQPLDAATVSAVILEVGEAICMQLERMRTDLLERQTRLERIMAQNDDRRPSGRDGC